MFMTTLKRWKGANFLMVPVIAGLVGVGGFASPATAQVVPPLSLKDVPAPEPSNL